MKKSDKQEEIVLPAGEPMVFRSMAPFFIKALLLAVILFGGISALLVRNEQNQVRLNGFFTTNPAVHMKISYIRERAGDINGAVMEIELALGLLELHSAEISVRGRYEARLDELRKKLPQRVNAKGK